VVVDAAKSNWSPQQDSRQQGKEQANSEISAFGHENQTKIINEIGRLKKHFLNTGTAQ
jgi:hypothetical protein